MKTLYHWTAGRLKIPATPPHLLVLLIIASPLALVGSVVPSLDAAQVTAVVEEVLCRTPESDEVERLLSTESVERLRWDLRTSAEGERVAAVRNAYLDVLARDPMGADCAGVRFWAQGDLTSDEIRRAIAAKPEGQRVAEVRQAFRDTLGRDPLHEDNATLRQWVEDGSTITVIKDALRTMRPLVGVYYFPWYATSPKGWGNGGTFVPAHAPKPSLGWYASNDLNVLRQQIEQMERTGFDFVILSVPVGQPVIWDNVHAFFRALSGHSLRAAVMLDDLYDDRPDVKSEWVSRVVTEFVHHPNYFRLKDGPLLPLYSAPLDFSYPNVALRTVYWTAQYDQGKNTFNDLGLLYPRDWPFWASPDPPLVNGLVPVVPGYDDGHLGRTRPMFLSRDGGKLYQTQWEQALAQRPSIITVYSWNEYFEQSAIEPTDAWGDRYLKLTACYIARAKSGVVIPCS